MYNCSSRILISRRRLLIAWVAAIALAAFWLVGCVGLAPPQFVGDNPRQILVVDVSGLTPRSGQSKARYKGQYYTLADSAWDRAAFNVLLILFQITVSDVSQVGIPTTIAK